MEGFVFREATIRDISFLVETIIEAEKSGTDKLSYNTVFGLSEEESSKYIAEMLMEEIDGCELSMSSFLLVENERKIAGAISSWVEGQTGNPSSILKGNLLKYSIPKKFFEKAMTANPIIRELHIENEPGTLQLGLVYIAAPFRGNNLVGQLINETIRRIQEVTSSVSEMHVQVFGNNFSAIRAYEKAGFKAVLVKESLTEEVSRYLPSTKKILMKKHF